MTLTRDFVDCDNNFDWSTTWLIPLLDKIVDYINALEAAQNQATDAVSSEVGVARSGFATLLAKIQDMDGVSADLKAVVQGLAAGVGPVVYDPAASYSENTVVVYDGGLYICIAADPVTGIAPPADGVWKNMLGWEKCPTPTLAGPLAADEGTVQRISLGQSYDANARYWPTVSGGTLSELMQFPSDGSQYAGEWGWEWLLPTLSVDVPHQILLYATKDGYARSNDAIWTVTVRDVPVEEATVSWPDTAENYAAGTVAGGIITAPARTVGCDSGSQLLAVSPEILIVNGKLILLDGSTESVLKLAVLVAAGDVIITDQGECVVSACVLETPAADPTNIVPVMTGETTDGWTIVSDTPADGGTVPGWNAFAQLYDSSSYGHTWENYGGTTREGTVVITPPAAMAVNGFRIRGYYGVDIAPNNAPRNVALYGKNTGGEWGEICSVADLVWPESPATEADKWHECVAPDTVTYDEYKLYCSNVGGSSERFAVDGLELLYGSSAVYAATLAQALPGVPTKAIKKTDVALKVAAGAAGQAFTEPDFTLAPAGLTYALDGEDLRVTGAEILLDNDPNLKRLAMAVSGEGVQFNRARAHIRRRS